MQDIGNSRAENQLTAPELLSTESRRFRKLIVLPPKSQNNPEGQI